LYIKIVNSLCKGSDFRMDKGPVWGVALLFLGVIFFVSEWRMGEFIAYLQ